MRQVSLSFYEKRKKQSGWAIIGGAQEEAPVLGAVVRPCRL